MTIKTNLFTQNLARSFYDDFANNDYYIFGSDYNLSTESVNNNFSKTDFLEKTIFGKKIPPEDFSYMVRNNIWQIGKVYTQYDDRAPDLKSLDFYIIVEPDNQEGGFYYIFKCLFNNYGAPSIEKPSYNNILYQDNSNYELSDGYIWKHISSIPNSISKKFTTRGYTPVIRDQNIESNAVDGIDVVLVENIDTNSGYERKTGNVLYDTTINTVTLEPTAGETLQSVPGFYTGRTLYIEKGEISSEIGARQYKIVNSGRDTLDQFFVVIEGYDSSTFAIQKNDTYQILPSVVIEGTGNGAEGIALLDVTNTKIVGVKILNVGSGYKNASAYVVDPINFNTSTGDVACKLRAIVPPKNGHGSDAIEELRVVAVCFSNDIASEGTSLIPNTNSYSKIGLTKNPLITGTPNTFDNRIVLNVSGTSGLNVGDTVYQTNGVFGTIHEINGNDLYIINYNGAYSAIFTTNLALKSETAGDFGINTIEYSTYTQRSGDVLYMTDFTPITRTETSVEKIKILIDF